MPSLFRPLASALSEIICEFGHLRQLDASYIVLKLSNFLVLPMQVLEQHY